MSRRIESLARRVESDPFFLAFSLASYAQSEGLNDSALASRLGCDLDRLSRIRLCRRPREDPRQFREDIARVAAEFDVSQDVLAQAVRRADALTAFRRAMSGGEGMLMAARDREGEDLPVPDTERDQP
jgi:hypothetical protein